MIALSAAHPAVTTLITSLVRHDHAPTLPRARHQHAAADAKLLADVVAMEPGLSHQQLLDYTADLRDEDLRQNVLVTCLEQQVTAEAEVRKIVRRAQNLKQWHRRQDRKRTSGFPDWEEPIADEGNEPLTGPVYDAVCLLPPNHRNVMLLRYVAELPIADIATALKVTRQTVHRWLTAAKSAIRGNRATSELTPTT